MILPQSNSSSSEVSDVHFPERTIMILDPCFDLLTFYSRAFRASGWRVVRISSSPSDFLAEYESLQVKPQLLLVESKFPSDTIFPALEEILRIHPSQEIVFVTSENNLPSEQKNLPLTLQHIPIILKSTYTIEELVIEVDEILQLSLL